MIVEDSRQGGTLYVKLIGELDHHTAGQVRQQVDAALEDGVTQLVWDMRELSFMDSSGVGLMIGRYKRVKDLGGTVGVCHIPAQVLKVMQATGLMNILINMDEVRQ